MESVLLNVLEVLTVVVVIVWIGLLLFWGQFWRADQKLEKQAFSLSIWPSVAVVIPARNEAELIGRVLRSHLTQSYPGHFRVIVVDDQSTDGTANIARQTAETLEKSENLMTLLGKPLPAGWTGKLWAMEQGFQYLQQAQPSKQPDYVLFTDADIEHSPHNLQQLVTKAETQTLDLVSLMVQLRTDSGWEKLLIPAFIFFFQMLYPFGWVNNPNKKMAAAAGGCALVRFSALERINGLQAIRQALIDDCALGAKIKAGGPIWLGLSKETISLRPYPNLKSIWDMVARSAYTQLNYSPLLLVGTVIGMALIYWVGPLGFWVGLIGGKGAIALIGLASWLLMAIAYWPTLKLYGGSPILALALPFIALLYTLMTIDSARRYWIGEGSAWKGRNYSDANCEPVSQQHIQ